MPRDRGVAAWRRNKLGIAGSQRGPSPRERGLQGDDLEAGDHLEVAKVGSRDAVAEFQGGHPDQQIGERKADALRLFSPSIWPVRRATCTVMGWMGRAVSSSWINWCRLALRCGVSARAAPCASSISVTTEIAISVLPAGLPEMAASICRAFCPWRSAVISTLESRISPMAVVLAVRGGSR